MPHPVADVLKFEILNCLHKILSYYEFMKKKLLTFKISYRPTICNEIIITETTFIRQFMCFHLNKILSDAAV